MPNADLLPPRPTPEAEPERRSAEALSQGARSQRLRRRRPSRITEMDALVAYLQMLGTLVDFKAAEGQEKPR
jgi:cytochrome c oxidase cbb3-type subunit 2